MKFIHLFNSKVPYVVLLIDMVNGYFLNIGTPMPISQFIKMIFTICLFIGLIDFDFKKGMVWFLASSFLIILPNGMNFLNGDLDKFFKSFVHTQRFMYSVLVYLYYIEFFNKGWTINIKRIIKYNIYIVILNIVLTLVGLGYYAYSGKIGAIGFFYAQNELSYILLLLFSFHLMFAADKSKSILLVQCIVLVLLTVVVGMKLSIVGFLLFSLLIISLRLKLYQRIILVSTGGVIVAYVIISLLEYINPLLKMWEHKYNQTGNIFLFLLSRRDVFLLEELSNFVKLTYYSLFFGGAQDITVEMDLFDTLFNYGVIGVILVYSFYTFVGVKILQVSNDIIRKGGIALMIFIMLASFFGGHFIYSGLVGYFFSLFFSYIIINRNISTQ